MIASLWTGLFRRLRGDIRHYLTSMAILMAGALCIVAAVGLAVAGGLLWLSTLIPSHLAALAIAGGLFLIGALTISLVLLRNGNPTSKPDTPDPKPEANEELVSQHIMQVALSEATKTPIKAAIAAVALGVVVGLLRDRNSP